MLPPVALLKIVPTGVLLMQVATSLIAYLNGGDSDCEDGTVKPIVRVSGWLALLHGNCASICLNSLFAVMLTCKTGVPPAETVNGTFWQFPVIYKLNLNATAWVVGKGLMVVLRVLQGEICPSTGMLPIKLTLRGLPELHVHGAVFMLGPVNCNVI